MGRSTRYRGNSELAESHAAGTPVTIVQPLVHSVLGEITFPKSRLWKLHVILAIEACRNLEALHEEVLKLPAEKTNSRSLRDDDLLKRMYGVGGNMVSNSTRAVQHMAQEIEVDQGVNLPGQTLVERIKEAAKLIGVEDVAAMPGYEGLIEIVNIRDGIEHPSVSNTYQGGGGRWDEIPPAWMISDRSLKAFGRFLQWINAFMDHVDAARAKLPQHSVQVTVVRGIDSLHQTKKPPQ